MQRGSERSDRERRNVSADRHPLRREADDDTVAHRLAESFERCERLVPFATHRRGVLDLDWPQLPVDIEHAIDLAPVAVAIEVDGRGTRAVPPAVGCEGVTRLGRGS